MRTTLLLCLLAILCPLAAVAADAPAPLADKLPGSSLVYVGWAGNTEAFQGSMLGQLIQQPTTMEIWKAIQKAAAQKSPHGEATAMLDLAQTLASHPVAAAMTDLHVGEDSKDITVKAVLVADLGKDQAKFAETLDKLLNSLPMNINESAENKTVGDVKFKVTKLDDQVHIAWGYQGTMLIVGLNGGEEAVATLKADASLTKAEGFTTAMKAVGGADMQCAYFVDLKKLMPALAKMEKMEVEHKNVYRKKYDIPLEEPQFDKVTSALGLDKATALAGTTRIVDKSLYSKAKLFSPAPHAGVLALFEGKPLTKDDLAVLPADADFAAIMRIDSSVVMTQTRAALQKLDPKMAKDMDEGLAEMQKNTGVDLEKDVLAALGDTWTVTTAASQGGSLTGLSASVTVKDAKKLQEAMDKLEASFLKKQNARPEEKEEGRQFSHYRSRQPELAMAKFGDMDVHYMKLPRMPIAPAWGMYKDRFYIALWPQVVASTARATGEKPGALTDDKAFMAGVGHFSDKPMAVTYTNLPQLVKQFYGFLMLGWTMGSMEMQHEGINVSPADLPTIGQIEKYLGPSMSAISCDKDGVTFEGYSSVPTMGLGNVVAMAPLSVSILMPSLAKARMHAKEAGSAMNLSNMGKAMALYSANNQDKLPPDIATLMKDGDLSEKMLINPVTGKKDYIYVGPDVPDTDSQAILVYENPDGRERINVLRRDFAVMTISVAELKRKLNKTTQPATKTPGEDVKTVPPTAVPQP